jgi:hypothetical protein
MLPCIEGITTRLLKYKSPVTPSPSWPARHLRRHEDPCRSEIRSDAGGSAAPAVRLGIGLDPGMTSSLIVFGLL